MRMMILLCVFVCVSVMTGCGRGSEPKESFTKRTTKKIANKALDAVDGVSEVIAERGKKSAETATKAAGELVAGAADGSKQAMDQHGQSIGSNLVSAAAPVISAAATEGKRQLDTPAGSNLVSTAKEAK